MSHAKVRNIFQSLLAEETKVGGSLEGMRLAYDNVKFVPNTNELYLALHLMPVDTFSDTLNARDHTAILGLFQVKVISGSAGATYESDEIVRKLNDIFIADKVYGEEFKVQIITPLKSGEGKAQDGKWSVPCYFEYRSDT